MPARASSSQNPQALRKTDFETVFRKARKLSSRARLSRLTVFTSTILSSLSFLEQKSSRANCSSPYCASLFTQAESVAVWIIPSTCFYSFPQPTKAENLGKRLQEFDRSLKGKQWRSHKLWTTQSTSWKRGAENRIISSVNSPHSSLSLCSSSRNLLRSLDLNNLLALMASSNPSAQVLSPFANELIPFSSSTAPKMEDLRRSMEAVQMLLAWMVCVLASKLHSEEREWSSSKRREYDLSEPGLLWVVVGREWCLSVWGKERSASSKLA